MISLIRTRKLRELREASPLTGLPGNTRILRELTARLTDGAPFALAHLDIDRFKSVNDAYGFVRGDELILLLARVLTATVRGQFIGHIGGDDFVVIAPPERMQAMMTTVAQAFERGAVALYDGADAARGHVISVDRRGRPNRYDLATLSVGVAVSTRRRFTDPAQVVAVAAELKALAKRQSGSYVAIDRRRAV